MIMNMHVMYGLLLYTARGPRPICTVHVHQIIILPVVRNARAWMIPLLVNDVALAIIDVGFTLIDSARPFLAAMRALPGEFGTRRGLPRDVRGEECDARGYWPL